MDKSEEVRSYDSIPKLFLATPDSITMKIDHEGPWHINVAKGGEWCYVSDSAGTGKSEVKVFVRENITPDRRQTSLILSSTGAMTIYKVVQKGGQAWFQTNYWKRTDIQRYGLRGPVKNFSEQTRDGKTFSYEIDREGHVTYSDCAQKTGMGGPMKLVLKEFHKYDADGHRTATVQVRDGDTVQIMYEYLNKGRFVAAGPDLDVEPKLYAMPPIVTDLSAVRTVYPSGDTVTVTYSFQGNKLYICSDDTVVVWEYSNGMPFNCGSITNVVFAENGMFSIVDRGLYRYRFLDNHHCMVVTDQTCLASDPADGTLTSVTSDLNENRDPVARHLVFRNRDAVTETMTGYFYDEMFNWLSCQMDYYDEEAGQLTRKELVRNIDYYMDR